MTEVLIKPEVVEVDIDPTVLEVVVEAPDPVEVEVTPTVAEVAIEAPPAIEVEIGSGWVVIEGGESVVELYDSNTVPASPPDTYLRFERDEDGDVQAVYLGTVD